MARGFIECSRMALVQSFKKGSQMFPWSNTEKEVLKRVKKRVSNKAIKRFFDFERDFTCSPLSLSDSVYFFFNFSKLPLHRKGGGNWK